MIVPKKIVKSYCSKTQLLINKLAIRSKRGARPSKNGEQRNGTKRFPKRSGAERRAAIEPGTKWPANLSNYQNSRVEDEVTGTRSLPPRRYYVMRDRAYYREDR